MLFCSFPDRRKLVREYGTSKGSWCAPNRVSRCSSRWLSRSFCPRTKHRTGCRELASFQDKWISAELNNNFGAWGVGRWIVLEERHSALRATRSSCHLRADSAHVLN